VPSSFSWRSDRGPAGAGRPPDRSRARRGALLPAVLILAAGAGCATPGGRAAASEIDAIQQQLWAIQKENAALLDQVRALREARAAAPAPEAGAAAEVRLRLEALERDLRSLTVRTQEAEQRLGAVSQELRATREALQAALQAAPAVAAVPGAMNPAGPGSIGAVPAGTHQAGAAPAGPGQQGPAAGGGPPAGGTIPLLYDDLYRQGHADYSQGNWSLALQELEEFVRRYPTSDLADDAQLLVGEVWLAQQKHAEAIAAFDRVIQAYPGGDRAPSAYLKKGLALLDTNRTADAVIQLQHVITAYPRTEEARIARERLRALGLRER
jgi:tol-pal system protein YbgF